MKIRVLIEDVEDSQGSREETRGMIVLSKRKAAEDRALAKT